VKRRVYDALNVLIASDILKKDGKTVCCAENTEDIGKILPKWILTLIKEFSRKIGFRLAKNERKEET